MYIPLFGSLSGRKWNDQERMLIPPFSLKTSNFCSPKNWEEWERMDLGLMKFLLKSLKYPFNISPFFSFSHKKIQLSFLHMLLVLCKVKLLPLVFLFLLSAAIFGYCSNQVCLSFSFSFRLFASLFFFFFLNFMNFLLVIHESDIQCFCTPKNQIKLAFCTPRNEKKRNEETKKVTFTATKKLFLEI